MKRAIVLSGGGAKGAYQIGVWKALKKLHLSYQIVTGTSVGALNGAFFVQKSYLRARYVWKNMDFSLLFEEEELEKYHHITTMKDLILMFGTSIFKGGIEVEKLKKLIDHHLKTKRFFHSSIDFGMITYNFTKMKPLILKKEEIAPEKLKNYVMASASCYPFFKMMKINDEDYIDGGFYDNLPINLAIDLGADEIIAINLEAPGVIRKVKNKDIPITEIKPRCDIGNFLNFEKEQSLRGMKLGYYDTMKTFKKLEGDYFTFKRGTLKKERKKYLEQFIEGHTCFLKENNLKTVLLSKRFFGFQKDREGPIFEECMERAGKIFDLDPTVLYRGKNWKKEWKKKNF